MATFQRSPDNLQAIEVAHQAHLAELSLDYRSALELYQQAIGILERVVANGQKKSEERRRAKLQLQSATTRVAVLRSVVDGNSQPPEPLPSVVTIDREMVGDSGIVPLSLVEMGLETDLPRIDPLSPDPTFLTPLLSPTLPNVTYHIYMEAIRKFPDVLLHFHVKDESKTHTLYTLAALKRRRYQIPGCTLFRASEYHAACVEISVQPIRVASYRSSAEHCLIGRTLATSTGFGKTIMDAPDRREKQWTPRRFTYGGKRFVWKEDKTKKFNMQESLYEVKREWPKPGSKTGKKEDEVFPRALVWGETKYAMSKVSTIHMVGGLDQLFREFLLASMLTRTMVGMYGHD